MQKIREKSLVIKSEVFIDFLEGGNATKNGGVVLGQGEIHYRAEN